MFAKVDKAEVYEHVLKEGPQNAKVRDLELHPLCSGTVTAMKRENRKALSEEENNCFEHLLCVVHVKPLC